VTFTVTVPVTVPAAPAGLGTVSVTRTGATVKWNSVPNATGYQVRLGTGTWVNANGTLGHTFSGLRKNTSYNWSVRALNGSTLGTAATSNFRTLR
jgi:hypothetical protein